MVAWVTIFCLALGYSGGGGPSGEGQSCDALNICASGTCPQGMTRVAPPERTAAYEIRTGRPETAVGTDRTSYVPGETVSIFIKVTQQRIVTRKEISGVKGVELCHCDAPYRHDGIDRVCNSAYMPTVKQQKKSKLPPYAAVLGPISCIEKNFMSAKYIGLLLYAVDAEENKVGAWELPEVEPVTFWTPPDPLCGGSAVMHADGRPKNHLHEFVFRAPPAGVGTLTFRALLKHGDTNGGAFYWPTAPASGTPLATPVDGTSGGDLTLTEATAAPSPQAWFKSTAVGQSCDDVCGALLPLGSQVCDLAALEAVGDDPSAVQLATQRFFSENTPALSRCAPSSPALASTSERWLYFHKTTNSSNTCSSNELAAPSCSAVPTEDQFKLRRLCPCKNSRRRLTFAPPHALPPRRTEVGSGADCPHYTPRRRISDTNAAAPSRGVVAPLAASLALSTLASLSGGGSLATTLIPLVLLAASQLPFASAHNWMWNPTSRASRASTAKPCRAKRWSIPDVHVNPGQEFEAEWATGHGESPNSGSHYFTVVKAQDEGHLVLVGSTLLDDYIDSALPSEHWTPHEHWKKRHLSWNSSQVGVWNGLDLLPPTGGTDNINHILEGKILMDSRTDPDYIVRANAFKCEALGRPSKAPRSGDNCVEVTGGLQQWAYTSTESQTDANVAYTNPKYPWIVSAHRFRNEGNNWNKQGDIARFKIDAPPGEYILHWYWRGYSDCHDVAVLPNDPIAGTVVPHTSDARYGIVGNQIIYSRIDHAIYAQGRVVHNMDWTKFNARSDALPTGQCSATPLPVNPGSSSNADVRLCYAIPPSVGNLTNFVGETHTEALSACKARCTTLGVECDGINVVPMTTPPAVYFTDKDRALSVGGSERAIPYGNSNCDSVCFNKEIVSQRAESFICYPVDVVGDREVEEDWTIAPDDPTDETWYSTVYKKDFAREFRGIVTPCMDYVSAAFPNGMCTLSQRATWRHGERCISCADQATFKEDGSRVPLWTPMAKSECRQCDHVAAPDLPPPTKAPTTPPAAYSDESEWPRNWTSPDGKLFIGWKMGGLEASDTAANGAITFTLGCPTCTASGEGWVAIGVNPSSPDASAMAGTSAVIWKVGEGTIREYELTMTSKAGVVPWGQLNHIGNIAIDSASGRASFSIGVGVNPSQTWNIGSSTITHATQRLAWAYGTNSWSYHIERGSVMLDLSPPSDSTLAPTLAPTSTSIPTSTPSYAQTRAPTGVGGTVETAAGKASRDRAVLSIGISVVSVVVACLLVALLAGILIITLIVIRSKYNAAREEERKSPLACHSDFFDEPLDFDEPRARAAEMTVIGTKVAVLAEAPMEPAYASSGVVRQLRTQAPAVPTRPKAGCHLNVNNVLEL